MGIKIQLFSLFLGIIFLLSVFRYIQKKSFNPSYSVLWIGVSLFLVSIPIFEPIYRWIAYSVIGMVDARNIIYIIIIAFLLVYLLFLTSKITKMSDQIQELISFTALLEKELSDKNENK